MAQKDNYVANVVNEEKVSQTPSVLVGRPESRERKTILKIEWDNYTEQAKEKVLGEVFGPLSPNPAHSGFDRQFFVDSLPEYPDQEDLNALFIIPQVKDDKVIGYEQWTFDVNTNKWRKVYGSDPNLKITKAPAKQAPQGTNPPKQAFAQIFNGNVAINNGKLYINGNEVTPGQGGGGGGDTGNHPTIYEFDDWASEFSNDFVEQLKIGDIVHVEPESACYYVTKKNSSVTQLAFIFDDVDEAYVYFINYVFDEDSQTWVLDEETYPNDGYSIKLLAPNNEGANEGDVLTNGAEGLVWQAPSGGGGSSVNELLLRKIRITVSLFGLDDDPNQVFYGDISLQDLFYVSEDLYDDYEDDINGGDFATLLEDMSDDLEDSADIRTDFANAINTLLNQNVVFKNITFDWSGTIRKGIIVDHASSLCFIDNGDNTVHTQEMSAFSNFANTTFCTITVSDTYGIND